jgi:hypothetical protein
LEASDLSVEQARFTVLFPRTVGVTFSLMKIGEI